MLRDKLLANLAFERGFYSNADVIKQSTWWKDKFKAPRFPAAKTVFDYYVDFENTKFEEWSKLSVGDVSTLIDTSLPISSFTVPTVDTIATQ